MHIHSTASDGISNAGRIVKEAKKKKIGVSITDYNHIRESVLASKNKEGVTVVPGIEVNSKEGTHILFYFYSPSDLEIFFLKYVKPNHNKNVFVSSLSIGIFDLIKAANDLNGSMVATHPFSPGLTGSYLHFKKNDDFIKNIVAVEGINSNISSSANEKAIHWAKAINKPVIGGSDSHFAGSIGTAYTLVESNENVDEILDAIIKGKCSAGGRLMNISEKTIDVMAMSRTWFFHPLYFAKKFIKDWDYRRRKIY